jgi:hypothetical protein
LIIKVIFVEEKALLWLAMLPWILRRSISAIIKQKCLLEKAAIESRFLGKSSFITTKKSLDISNDSN